MENAMGSFFEKLADRLLETAVAVQQVPAPTHQERERSDFVCKLFTAAGLAGIHQDRLGNVYGRIPGGDAPPVVVSAHLDTVFGRETDLSVTREPGRISGPGIGDNSLAVATLTGIKEMVERFEMPLAGDIILVANTCEEGLGDLKGIRAVVKALAPENPKAYLVLEGFGVDRIYTRGVGSRRYRISARTKGGHSWTDFGEESAVHTLVRVAAALTDLPLPRSPKTTLNIGVIQGGRSVNTIADTAYFLLDLRSESEEHLAGIEAAVLDCISENDAGCGVISRELIGSRPAGAIAEDSPLVRLCQATYEGLGLASPELKAGSTDANIPFSEGIPAVCLGLTLGADAHLESEYIETAPFAGGLEILSGVLEGIWNT